MSTTSSTAILAAAAVATAATDLALAAPPLPMRRAQSDRAPTPDDDHDVDESIVGALNVDVALESIQHYKPSVAAAPDSWSAFITKYVTEPSLAGPQKNWTEAMKVDYERLRAACNLFHSEAQRRAYMAHDRGEAARLVAVH
jgi:hypothetical protein